MGKLKFGNKAAAISSYLSHLLSIYDTSHYSEKYLYLIKKLKKKTIPITECVQQIIGQGIFFVQSSLYIH